MIPNGDDKPDDENHFNSNDCINNSDSGDENHFNSNDCINNSDSGDENHFNFNDFFNNSDSDDYNLSGDNFFEQDQLPSDSSWSMNDYVLNNQYRKENEIIENSEKENQKKENNKSSRRKSSKSRVYLSKDALYLKNNFYLVFTNKKKFKKELVNEIHQIIQKPLGLKPLSREIKRFQEKYFVEYANNSHEIIEYLVKHKNEIIEKVPQLKLSL